MKKIPPVEISKMNNDDLILVNRIRINSKLVEFEIRNLSNCETTKIMRNAITEMKEKELRSKKPSMGVMMKVGDVKKIFDNIESLPGNSFAAISAI